MLKINYQSFLKLVFILYWSFLLSPYGKYFLDSIYLWHLVAVPLAPIFIMLFVKATNKSIPNLVFFIYLVLVSIASFVSYGFSIVNVFKIFQFLAVLSLFFGILFYSKKEIKFNRNYINLFWKTESIVVYFTFVQFVVRAVAPEYSLSEYQNFRIILDPIRQCSSFFLEPRGLSQFLNASLFINLFLTRELNKKRIVKEVLALLLTFSLGGLITMFVIFILFLLKNVKFNKQSLVIIPFFVFVLLLLSTNVFKPVTNRIDQFTSNTQDVPIQVIVENSYKLNHVDFYHQYSNEFEKKYGFKGGSTSVSVLAEFSWLYKTLKEKPLFGYKLINDERYVSLNGIVDLIIRFGLIGFIIFILSLKQYIRLDFKTLMFLVFFMAIDGALSKPQVWFLMGSIIVFQKSFKEINFEAKSCIDNNTNI